MGRLLIIDGFRGFFLLFMAVVHFDGVLDTRLGKFNHHQFGWVEDAQGFVFISGLIVGIVYGRKYLRRAKGQSVFGPVLGRVSTIYLHQATLVLVLLTAALLLGPAAPGDFEPYRQEPVTFTAFSLMLVSASGHMGILPMYIFFLLATPLAFVALERGYTLMFVLVSLLLWLTAQVQLVEILCVGLQDVLRQIGVNIRLGIYFNAFGWQLLFFGGLYFGFRTAQGRLDLRFLDAPQTRSAFLLALAAVFALGVFDRIVDWQLFGADYSGSVFVRTSRSALSYIYPVAFLLDLFVVAWLLRVGAEDRSAALRGAAAAIAWVFTRRPLVLLGQHSLHVFSLHVLLYYLLATLAPVLAPGAVAREFILIGMVASLYLAAFGHAWLQGRDKPIRLARAEVAANR